MPSAKGRPERKAPRPKKNNAENKARWAQAKAEVKAAQFTRALDAVKGLPPFDGEYTDALGAVMADMVVDGVGVDEMATLNGMPPARTIMRWICDERHPYSKVYYAAKDAMVPLLEERTLAEALRPRIGVVRTRRQALDKDGRVVELVEEREADNVERSRLAFMAYQHQLSWLRPRKHGRLAVPDGGKPNDQLKSLFDALMAGPAKEEGDEP